MISDPCQEGVFPTGSIKRVPRSGEGGGGTVRWDGASAMMMAGQSTPHSLFVLDKKTAPAGACRRPTAACAAALRPETNGPYPQGVRRIRKRQSRQRLRSGRSKRKNRLGAEPARSCRFAYIREISEFMPTKIRWSSTGSRRSVPLRGSCAAIVGLIQTSGWLSKGLSFWIRLRFVWWSMKTRKGADT